MIGLGLLRLWRRVSLEIPVEGRPVLVAVLRSASLRAAQSGGSRARLEGRVRLGVVTLTRSAEPGLGPVLSLRARDARLSLEAPFRAAAVAAEASTAALSAEALDYASLSLNASVARVRARLPPGGGVAARARSSNVVLDLDLPPGGEYWVEARLLASNLVVRVPPGTAATLEGRRPLSIALALPPEPPEPRATLRLSIEGFASNVAVRSRGEGEG